MNLGSTLIFFINQNSIVSMAVREMIDMLNLDTWFRMAQKIKSLWSISGLLFRSKERVSSILEKKLNGAFDSLVGPDNCPYINYNGNDHYKLMFYKTLNCRFYNLPGKAYRAFLS